MPPRPFPQSLSIGTDICRYKRFAKYFRAPHQQQQHSQDTTTTGISSSQTTLLFKLFDKLFLPSEQREFWRRFRHSNFPTFRRLVLADSPQIRQGTLAPQTDQWLEGQVEEAARYIGGRWAAKEAVIKAFSGNRRLMLRDVEIRKDAKTKQPLAVVCDEGCKREYRSAEEVYAALVLRWGLREEMEKQGQEGGASDVAAPAKGLRITKVSGLEYHTAVKKDLPQQELPASEPETTPAVASASASTPSILSENGILDLNAVTKALDQQDLKIASSPSTNPSQEQPEVQQQNQDTSLPEDVEQEPQSEQSEQSRLREEIKRLRQEELAEDAWNNLQGQVVKVSISHDGEYCIATALAAV